MLRTLKNMLGNLPATGNWARLQGQIPSYASCHAVADGQLNTKSAADLQALLLQAVKEDESELIKQYLAKGLLDINSLTPDGSTVLIEAVKAGSLSAVDELLHCGNLNVNTQDKNGYAALQYAVKNGNCILITWLLMRDTQQHIKNHALVMAFSQYCRNELCPDPEIRVQSEQLHQEIIARLLHAGADPGLGGLAEYVVSHPALRRILEEAGDMAKSVQKQRQARLELEEII
jgi:hypothetical protein